jgi:hypothetical protein
MDGAAGAAARGRAVAEGPGGRVEEAREECPSEAAGAEHLHCFSSASPRGGRKSGVAVAIRLGLIPTRPCPGIRLRFSTIHGARRRWRGWSPRGVFGSTKREGARGFWHITAKILGCSESPSARRGQWKLGPCKFFRPDK